MLLRISTPQNNVEERATAPLRVRPQSPDIYSTTPRLLPGRLCTIGFIVVSLQRKQNRKGHADASQTCIDSSDVGYGSFAVSAGSHFHWTRRAKGFGRLWRAGLVQVDGYVANGAVSVHATHGFMAGCSSAVRIDRRPADLAGIADSVRRVSCCLRHVDCDRGRALARVLCAGRDGIPGRVSGRGPGIAYRRRRPGFCRSNDCSTLTGLPVSSFGFRGFEFLPKNIAVENEGLNSKTRTPNFP